MVVLAVCMAEEGHKAGEALHNFEVERNLVGVADMPTAAVGIAEEEHHTVEGERHMAEAEHRTAVVGDLEEPRRAGHKLVVVTEHHIPEEAQEIHMVALDILLEVGMDSAVDMGSDPEEDMVERRRSLEAGRRSPDKAVGKTFVLIWITVFCQFVRAGGPRQGQRQRRCKKIKGSGGVEDYELFV